MLSPRTVYKAADQEQHAGQQGQAPDHARPREPIGREDDEEPGEHQRHKRRLPRSALSLAREARPAEEAVRIRPDEHDHDVQEGDREAHTGAQEQPPLASQDREEDHQEPRKNDTRFAAARWVGNASTSAAPMSRGCLLL